MKLRLLFILLITSGFCFAQAIPDDIKPPSWSLEESIDLVPFELPSFDLKKLQQEDEINDQDKSIPWRFGHDIYVDHSFNDVGEWTTLKNGDRIWRMSYASRGAYSLNFMFDVFKIPEGAKLYIYNNSKSDLLRPFTYHNNNPEEVLGTWLVEGDQAWIEYYQPANVTGEAKITVGSVIHGYRTAKSYEKTLGQSGDCNQDVDCDITPASDPYGINTVKDNIKSSGALILVGTSDWCSGTLINNTNNDGTPYLMTANHCGGSESSWSFRFNWRSPNPSCGTTTASTGGSYNQTVSGAILRASSTESDMELVEITDTSFFENNTDLVWAGWNRSTTDVPAINFGFHHPSGDIQKVSRYDAGAYRDVSVSDGLQVWVIDDWDLGVTEGGSSGSGLFNETGHLIGMLNGGVAACSGTNDNGSYDHYGRFDVAWDFGSSTSSRLKEWLDPSDSGIEVLDQYPALVTYDIDARANAGTNSSEICSEDFTPQVTLINSGELPLTSAEISYYFDAETSTSVSWTGSLLYGESVVVAAPVYTDLSSGSHTFTINVSNPNGTVDENTANDTFGYNFEVSPTYTTTSIVFNLLTDNYPDETSWQLYNSSDVLVASGPDSAYEGAANSEEIIEIPSSNECYTFVILDSYGDGICCGFFTGSGSYTLEDENGNEIASGGEFGASESVTFRVEESLSVTDFNLDGLIHLYPNPTTNILNVDLTNLDEDVSYQVFNTLGQDMQTGSLKSNTTSVLNLSSYQSGVYFIKLSTNSGSMTQKLIKK